MKKFDKASDCLTNFAQVARTAGKFALALACAVLMTAAFLNAQTASGNVENGKKVYPANTCDTCHGASGEGTNQGPKIVPPGGFPNFLSQIRNPVDEMPSYSKEKLSDAEAADIYAFLQSAAAPAGKDQEGPSPTQAGNAENGKKLYPRNTCDTCHGMSGEGADQGPQIVPPGGYASFVSQMRTPANKMPAYSKERLSDAEVADIYAFLQSLGSTAPPVNK